MKAFMYRCANVEFVVMASTKRIATWVTDNTLYLSKSVYVCEIKPNQKHNKDTLCYPGDIMLRDAIKCVTQLGDPIPSHWPKG